MIDIQDLSVRLDDRGVVISLDKVSNLIGVSELSLCHVVTLRPGTIRGNHYHPKSTEHILFIDGKVEVIVGMEKNLDGHSEELNLVVRKVFEPTPGQILRIPAGIPHAVKNVGQNDAVIMCIYEMATDSESTIACNLSCARFK